MPAMPVNDLIVLGFIVSMFALFMVVLGAVAWWSNRPVKARRLARTTHAARRPTAGGGLSAQH